MNMDSDLELFEEDNIDTDIDIDNPVDEPVEEQDSDKEEYSKKVQKRINKVVEQRNIERDRRLKIEQENAKLKELLYKAQADTHQEAIERLKKDKIDALSIGDHEAVVNIDDKLMAYRYAKQVDYVQPEPQTSELPEALIDWQKNNAWIFDDTNPKTKKANEIYSTLLSEGYDDSDHELYQEIDKRMKRQSPPPTAAPDRGQVISQGGVQFTAQDKDLMMEFGLDPDNKQHRTQWAISKKAMQNGE